MSESFDLTTRPWIPCERLDGSQVELSTRDVLVEAHALRGLVEQSPLVLATLYRHLLAMLHRTYAGPRNMKEWTAIAKSGQFDATRIEAYLGSVRNRMDLFHPTYPFAQTRGLVEQFDVDPIDALELERSSWGSARELFQHRPDSYQATMTPARAARALLAHQAFATGGLVRKPSEPTSATAAPLVRCAVVMLRGNTLFDTLRSNLLRYDPIEHLPISASDDAPSWEQPPPPARLGAVEPKRHPKGWLDALTWLSRRIELVQEGGSVTGWVRAVGQGVAEGGPLDPMVTYRADEKRGLVSMGMNPARAFWRDCHALFEVASETSASRFRRPLAIDLVARPAALDVLGNSAAYSVEVMGLAADQSKVEMVRIDRVHAHAKLFDDPGARDAIQHSLKRADTAVFALKNALRLYARHALSPGGRNPDAKDVTAFVDSLGAESAAWSALGVAFAGFMRALEAGPDAAEAAFAEGIQTVVRDEFKRATARPETAARWLKARAIAERSLRISLSLLRDSPTDPLTPSKVSP